MMKISKRWANVSLLGVALMTAAIARNGFAEDGPFRALIKAKSAPEARADVDAKIAQPGDYTFTFNSGGMARYYRIHVPTKYNASVPAALVLSLHGGGGDMRIQATDRYYKMISKSEQEGFIVAFPNGYSQFRSGIFATWNAGNCCGKARDNNIDDVGFIKEVVTHISHQLNIHRGKIFASGMSNGAMMSQRLACDAADVFKAVAAVAGTDNTKSCNPKKPISILEIHAKNDDHVLFDGGAGKEAFKDPSVVTNFTSVPETISRWVKRDGCVGSPQRVLQKTGAYCDLYSSCADGAQIKLCVTDTGGHSWPGGEKPRNRGERPSTAISADDLIWDFFKSLVLP